MEWSGETSEPEVTPEMQAALNIKLAEDVRKLIRSEVSLALRDYNFMSSLYTGAVAQHVLTAIQTDPALVNQLSKIIGIKLTQGIY